MKNELQEILGEDFEIIFDNIIYGSLLTKVYVFFKKSKICCRICWRSNDILWKKSNKKSERFFDI